MSNLFELLYICMTFHIAMYLACKSLSYTFEYELLKRQFNCNMLCRRAFNECNECVFTFPVLSLSRVSYFFQYQTRISRDAVELALVENRHSNRLRECKTDKFGKIFFKENREIDLFILSKLNNDTHYANYFPSLLKNNFSVVRIAASSIILSIHYLC